MTVYGSEVGEHYQHQARALSPVIEGYRGLVTELQQANTLLIEQHVKARQELAQVYLTELSEQAFARVERLTGFKGFERRDPRQAMEHERRVLEHANADIERDDQFLRRDQLVGPAGTLTQELDNARTTLEPLEQECSKFESQPGFLELIQVGYDTPTFDVKWWNASYWKYWASGDRICKALGMGDFGDDVLPAYKKVAEPRNFMREEVKRFTSLIDEVHGVVQRRDKNQQRLANLEAIYLAEAQGYLGEHLEHADAALLEQWAAAEPTLLRAVQMGVRKIAGLTAKKRFLVDLAQGVEDGLIPQLQQRLTKAHAKVAKFRRPKHKYALFQDDMITPNIDQKMQALEQQRLKTSARAQKLVAAENYAGFDLRNDEELWWMYLMQSPPPRLAPHLFDYYQRRPNAQPVVDPDFVDLDPQGAGEAMATAFAAGDIEQGGYLS